MPLVAHEFTRNDLHEVQTFECGTQPWELILADWIRGEGVVQSMSRGTQVWLYKTPDGTLIGYGSLGKTRWKWPEPDSPYVRFSIIPALAVKTPFQGQPANVPKSERYSTQIMDDLLRRSIEHDTDFVVLEVHNRNARAIQFYRSYGFEMSSITVEKRFDEETHLYRRMSLRK